MKARFKLWLRKIVLICIRKLRKLEKKILCITDPPSNYSSLSPIGDADGQKHYSDALDWALNNRSKKDIKNIALTGPYGAGKSTILKTYYNNYNGKELKFLFISLATFKEEAGDGDNVFQATDALDGEKQEVQGKNQMLRLIETSILQQIFYHEDDDKIPDSRFKKIRSFGCWQLLRYSLGYSLFLASLFIHFKPEFIDSILIDWGASEQLFTRIRYCSIAVIVVGIFMLIFNSIRMIRSVTLQKLNFQNAEIGIGVNQNKSILNHHIDEILYFFSVRPYNVVIIEDLDRFKQTEIFTKLREINLLLNNSKKTKRKNIVFIYAVRDDMFTDKERTKFFDFIIPVIPIINSSNSAKILMAKRDQFGYQLTDDVIEDLSYFIDDMRLLHNITNEYYLYKELLDHNLSQDKLFAIITYKNIHPQDFVELSTNSGEIYNLIFSKKTEIEKRLEPIQKQIADIKAEIKRLDDLFITNLRDLRLLYIVQLLPKLKNFKDFKFDDEIITLEDMTTEDKFAHLENDRLQIEFYQMSYGSSDRIGTMDIKYSFTSIEKMVDKDRTYKERVQEINDLKKNKKKVLQGRILDLEREKELLRNLPVAEVMKKNMIQLEPGQGIKLQEMLVRNGYIAEDYLDYISLFHDGDISRKDYQFMLNLKNNQALEMDYALQKTERLITKINPLTFQTHLVLNYSLFDQLLKDPEKNNERLERVFNVLKDESETSIKFISNYLQRTHYLGLFLRKLAKSWPNIWCYFENYEEFGENEKQELFTWLITFVENEQLLTLSNHYDLTVKIESDPSFPQIISDQGKLQDLFKVLNIKFKSLDINGTVPETLKYIYEHNHYQLNPEMVKSMVKQFGKFDLHTFETKNYSALIASECPQILAYVNENIDTYIEKVFLRLEKNTAEEESTILKLLNNPSLKTDLKIKIVAKMDSKITILSKVMSYDIYTSFFIHNKVVSTWDNVYHDFLIRDKQISTEVIEYLNKEENSKSISRHAIQQDGKNNEDYELFCRNLMEVTTFNDEVLRRLTRCVPEWFSDLDLSNHTPEQVKVLVTGRIIEPSIESFEYLKENFNPLHIVLFESEPELTMEIFKDIPMDSDDIRLILKSSVISLSNKMKVLDDFNEDLVKSNNSCLKELLVLLHKHTDFKPSATLIEATLLYPNGDNLQRIEVLLKKKVADHTFLQGFLNSLGGNYELINDRSRRPDFPKDQLHLEFLSLLQAQGLIVSFSENKGKYRVYHKLK